MLQRCKAVPFFSCIEFGFDSESLDGRLLEMLTLKNYYEMESFNILRRAKTCAGGLLIFFAMLGGNERVNAQTFARESV
jgi:hypothetical protein